MAACCAAPDSGAHLVATSLQFRRGPRAMSAEPRRAPWRCALYALYADANSTVHSASGT